MAEASGLFEIVDVFDGRAERFLEEHRREALSTLYDFRVVWHERAVALAALRSLELAGALRGRIAASLAHLDELAVAPQERGRGVGRALVARFEVVANYYNCHKVTLQVPAGGGAQQFFERLGYHVEAVLPQHTFKLDVAVLRKFLL